MPEITIQIGDSVNPLGFRDNDIVHAMNDLQLLWHHTLAITDHRKIPGGFFKPVHSLAYRRLRAFSHDMIQRISAKEIRVTDLTTSEEIIKSDVPNAKKQVCHVRQYMARAMAAGKRAMFGNEQNAIWFEGWRDVTLPRIGTLWADHITSQTGLRAVDHRRRDYSANHLKRYLIIVTNDFSDARREWLEAPQMDNTDPDNPVMVRRRRRYIDWRNLPGMSGATIDEILDRHRRVDIHRDLIRDETALAREHV